MLSSVDILKIINSGNLGSYFNGVSEEGLSIIKNKINEIPNEFYEPRISIDDSGKKNISLIEFSMQIAGMDTEKKLALMQKYHISPYDINTIQRIVDSIKVTDTYERRKSKDKEQSENKKEISYGFALSTQSKIDKAYPLWIAFLYSESLNPLQEIKARLKSDGVEDKYDPQYIVGLIEHTNFLMKDKPISEKKDFFVNSINGILDERENIKPKSKIKSIEVER